MKVAAASIQLKKALARQLALEAFIIAFKVLIEALAMDLMLIPTLACHRSSLRVETSVFMDKKGIAWSMKAYLTSPSSFWMLSSHLRWVASCSSLEHVPLLREMQTQRSSNLFQSKVSNEVMCLSVWTASLLTLKSCADWNLSRLRADELHTNHLAYIMIEGDRYVM